MGKKSMLQCLLSGYGQMIQPRIRCLKNMIKKIKKQLTKIIENNLKTKNENLCSNSKRRTG